MSASRKLLQANRMTGSGRSATSRIDPKQTKKSPAEARPVQGDRVTTCAYAARSRVRERPTPAPAKACASHHFTNNNALCAAQSVLDSNSIVENHCLRRTERTRRQTCYCAAILIGPKNSDLTFLVLKYYRESVKQFPCRLLTLTSHVWH